MQQPQLVRLCWSSLVQWLVEARCLKPVCRSGSAPKSVLTVGWVVMWWYITAAWSVRECAFMQVLWLVRMASALHHMQGNGIESRRLAQYVLAMTVGLVQIPRLIAVRCQIRYSVVMWSSTIRYKSRITSKSVIIRRLPRVVAFLAVPRSVSIVCWQVV